MVPIEVYLQLDSAQWIRFPNKDLTFTRIALEGKIYTFSLDPHTIPNRIIYKLE